jgi:hypothetical protein
MTEITVQGGKMNTILVISIDCPGRADNLPFSLHICSAGDRELAKDSTPEFKEETRLDEHPGKAYILGDAVELDVILPAYDLHPESDPSAADQLDRQELTDRFDQMQRHDRSGEQGICS